MKWSVGDQCMKWSVGDQCTEWSVGDQCTKWSVGVILCVRRLLVDGTAVPQHVGVVTYDELRFIICMLLYFNEMGWACGAYGRGEGGV